MRDVIVKKLFTSDTVGKRYSAAIIAGVLGLDEEDVYNSIELKSNDISNNVDFVGSKTDALYESDKIIINIEFNNFKSNLTNVKNDTYVVQLYMKQLKTKEDYKKLKKVIQINIDNYDYFNAGLFLYHSVMMEETLHIRDLQNIEIYHLNLQYLREIDYNNLVSDASRLQKLIYILVCEDTKVLDEICKGDALMTRVQEEAARFSEDLATWAYYDQSELERLGREEAVEEGRIIGLEQGHFEEKIRIAKELLAVNMPIEQILAITKLSKEELASIICKD